MKKIILAVLVLALVTVSCNKKVQEKGTVVTHMMNDGSEMMNGNTEMKTYACSMHPEIIGMKGHKCSKCGIELTEKTTDKKVVTTIYSCPMHPEIIGMKGDKCSKCGIELTEKTTDKKVVTTIYSCPMHPEVQGKLNSKCSKCGMPLTEPVVEQAK